MHRRASNTQKGAQQTRAEWTHGNSSTGRSQPFMTSPPLQLVVPDQPAPCGFTPPCFGSSWEPSKLPRLSKHPRLTALYSNNRPPLWLPLYTLSYLTAGTMPSLPSYGHSTPSSSWATPANLICFGISSFPYLSVFYYAILGWIALRFATRVWCQSLWVNTSY